MSEVTYVESDKASISSSDLLVKIIKIPPYVPSVKKYNKISVYGTKTGSNGDVVGTEISESDIGSYTSKLSDGSELNFTGKIKLWNVTTLTQAHVDEMQSYGDTLVVFSGKSSEIKTNSSSLKFGDLKVWITETVETTTLKDFINVENRGAFLDKEKKGKALYAISKLLEDTRNIKFSTQITSSSFKGVTSMEKAESLDDLGYSYFFKTMERCWVRGFWLGKQQARSVYMDAVITYDIKEELARGITEGMPFNDEEISIIENNIGAVMKSNPYVTKTETIKIPYQPDTNKSRGKIEGVHIKYRTQQEVRGISITMRGGA